MYIGLFAGGFKPFTSGHYHVLQKASSENDLVYLFVSNKDRIKKGEHPVTFQKLKFYWKILQKAFPKNVKVIFSDNPTSSQFDILNSAEADDSNFDVFTIYADSSDIKRYDNPRIKEKTLPRLYSNDQLIFQPISRDSGVNVSGTKLRKALQTKSPEAFVSMLPDPVKQKGFEIYKSLL